MDANPARSGGRSLVLAGIALLLLGYCGLAVATAFDRAAMSSDRFAALVPEPFQQRALAREASRLREAGKADTTLAMAEKLVARDPMSFDSVGHLATARFARDDAAGALAAFKVSAALGWRDAWTQAFWMQAALGSGDYDNAALRFGALIRQWPRAPVIDQFSALFEADPRGRLALARRIALGAPWAETYAAPVLGQSADQLRSRASVLIAAAGFGSKLGCDKVAGMTVGLADAHPMVAAQLWRAQCSRAAGEGSVANGRFADLDKVTAASPFDWRFPGDGALEIDFVNSGDGSQALQVRSSAAARVPVAQQMIPLPAGRYRVSWTSDAADAATAGRILASLSCRLERQQANPAAGNWSNGRHDVQLEFNGGCQAPFLQLWLAPGNATLQIDNVSIAPA